MADVMSAEISHNGSLSLDTNGVNDDTDVSRGVRSRQTSWLYRCMVADCSATFERLADLRLHFIDVHQSGNRMKFYGCSLPNSAIDACTVNAFKARLDKFWQHQLVKFDFTADLTGTGNRSEEVIK